MPDDDRSRKGDPPSKAEIQDARAAYHREKRARRRAKRAWVKAKHRTRKAKHRLARLIDRRKKSRGKHQENEIRDGIVDYAIWGTKNEPAIHYAQIRPYPSNPRQLPQYSDCSGFATNAVKDAGGDDPNGDGFSGYGFTGTLYNHCPKVAKADAKPGDLLEHGGYPGSHVNVLIEKGSKADPMVVSHGQESGPRLYPTSVEIAAHAGQSANWLRTVN